jgi:hypothetical protein
VGQIPMENLGSTQALDVFEDYPQEPLPKPSVIFRPGSGYNSADLNLTGERLKIELIEQNQPKTSSLKNLLIASFAVALTSFSFGGGSFFGVKNYLDNKNQQKQEIEQIAIRQASNLSTKIQASQEIKLFEQNHPILKTFLDNLNLAQILLQNPKLETETKQKLAEFLKTSNLLELKSLTTQESLQFQKDNLANLQATKNQPNDNNIPQNEVFSGSTFTQESTKLYFDSKSLEYNVLTTNNKLIIIKTKNLQELKILNSQASQNIANSETTTFDFAKGIVKGFSRNE